MISPQSLSNYLSRMASNPRERRVRLLCLLSAAIAVCRADLTLDLLRELKRVRVQKRAVYEIILQSYLFLGFPRMIEAILIFNEVYGGFGIRRRFGAEPSQVMEKWFKNGVKLCREVYGSNYERLKGKFMEAAPELFQWMVSEGYGKVLSRPGPTQIERELAEVAALIVERRARQLISHIIGSINVGAGTSLLRRVNEDTRLFAGERTWRMTERIISRIEKRNEITN